jgi:type VI secretion system protein ImpE
MTPHQAFADGQLAEAVSLQESAVAARPDDAAARLFLVELLAFAARLDEAETHLAAIRSDDPAWPASARGFRRLFRAERRRSITIRRPLVLPEPVPAHAKRRWLAVKRLRDGNPADAVRWTDRADAASPDIEGFLDGQEFDSLRDADDRFASVLEAVAGGRWVWFPWEKVRRVKLELSRYALDRLYRPAEVRLRDGSDHRVHLPLVYPGSHAADGVFAAGLETDRICPDDGPIRCIGGKLLLAGAAEVPLAECRMIEVR